MLCITTSVAVADPTIPVTQNSTCSNVPGGDQFAVRPSLVADSYTVSIESYLNKRKSKGESHKIGLRLTAFKLFVTKS